VLAAKEVVCLQSGGFGIHPSPDKKR